jgi:excisionase family DNA binding protein
VSEERLLTVPEVAERLRVNPESVRRWIRSGRLKGVLFGGTKTGYRVAESDLKRFIATSGEQN